MRPDPLSEAAARRHELTRARAVQALRELDRAGTPVTFAGVAQAAGVSRSWLYQALSRHSYAGKKRVTGHKRA